MKYSNGSPAPLGSQAVEKGVNFAIFSANATACELCIFSDKEHRLPMHKTGDIWHLFVEGVGVGTEYGFRVSGEVDEAKGALFNPQKVLIDPYAKRIVGSINWQNDEALSWYQWNDAKDNAPCCLKSVVVSDEFDWSDEIRPHYAAAERIIYEAHVKGFSQLNDQIPEPLRGTYAGLAHPVSIDYLKKLGVTTIELQPITHHLDEVHLQRLGLTNYWGYSVLGHSAVEPLLAADQADPIGEFKQMVKTLHNAGFEVMLDVVFNHTVEAGKDGAMLCQRGVDNQSYYWLNEKGDYHNWTGCGNALNLSNPNVCQWAVDSLIYWVEQCHIDGFRFDLATTLGREPAFSPFADFFERLKDEPKLQGVKWIAEPWDIGFNGYQVGGFPQHFAEWNDRYRDDMRDFFLNESGDLANFARRLAGSDDLFWRFSPAKSVNYFASHDGFNLQDLVSYNQKHNLANGENNRDGDNHNHSNNHGVEGETDNFLVNLLRNQTACSLLATLFLSNGTPMLKMGDELGHSQQGNNNAYCQDNPITWINWQKIDTQRLDYVQKLIKLRKRISLLCEQSHWWTENDVQWLTPQGKPMQLQDWQNRQTKAIQILLQKRWLILVNGKKAKQAFTPPDGSWRMQFGLDTATIHSNPQTQEVQLLLEQMGICVFKRKFHSL